MFEEDPAESWAMLFRPVSVGYTHQPDIMDHDIAYKMVSRHRKGDWGECSKAEIEANEIALEYGGCVVSIFRDNRADTFYVVTEDVISDRPRTDILSYQDYNLIAR